MLCWPPAIKLCSLLLRICNLCSGYESQCKHWTSGPLWGPDPQVENQGTIDPPGQIRILWRDRVDSCLRPFKSKRNVPDGLMEAISTGLREQASAVSATDLLCLRLARRSFTSVSCCWQPGLHPHTQSVLSHSLFCCCVETPKPVLSLSKQIPGALGEASRRAARVTVVTSGLRHLREIVSLEPGLDHGHGLNLY